MGSWERSWRMGGIGTTYSNHLGVEMFYHLFSFVNRYIMFISMINVRRF